MSAGTAATSRKYHVCSMLRGVAWGAVIAAVLLADPERAAAAEGYVDLRNGTRVEGTIVQLTPMQRVVIRRRDGVETTIEWGLIAAIQDGPLHFTADGAVTVDPIPPPSGSPAANAPAAATPPPSSTPTPPPPPPRSSPPAFSSIPRVADTTVSHAPV